jgi:hypothetical protein
VIKPDVFIDLSKEKMENFLGSFTYQIAQGSPLLLERLLEEGIITEEEYKKLKNIVY